MEQRREKPMARGIAEGRKEDTQRQGKDNKEEREKRGHKRRVFPLSNIEKNKAFK